MRNHNEKTRDMARSVLPSTDRANARAAKKNSSRVARRRVGHELRDLERFVVENDFDDFEGDLCDYTRPDEGWGSAQFTYDGLVWDRRQCDKVAPLIRWASACVDRDPHLRDAPVDARRAHFAKLLGPTLIGRHALRHLERVIDDV